MGTAALIIVLSVFNGMEDLLAQKFNLFNPDFVITKKEGKSFAITPEQYAEVKKIKDVEAVEDVVSDLVMFTYDNKQYIVTLKGVTENYIHHFDIKNIITEGGFSCVPPNDDLALVGFQTAADMNLNLHDSKLLKVYYPKRHKKNLGNVADAFNTQFLYPSGVFSTYTDNDAKYLFASLDFVRDLTNYRDEVTQIEVKIRENASAHEVQKRLKTILGDTFHIKNRYEQEALIFKAMKTEKLASYCILAFILLVAAFNVIGSLTMLILEKKKDFKIWYSMGAPLSFIKRVFLIEGMMLSLFGGLIGMLIAFVICFLQYRFHIITFPNSETSNYIINYYPVLMKSGDFILVLLTITVISITAAWLPAAKIK